jgi:hypothetical protein
MHVEELVEDWDSWVTDALSANRSLSNTLEHLLCCRVCCLLPCSNKENIWSCQKEGRKEKCFVWWHSKQVHSHVTYSVRSQQSLPQILLIDYQALTTRLTISCPSFWTLKQNYPRSCNVIESLKIELVSIHPERVVMTAGVVTSIELQVS